jgi:hypothetical protein
VNPEALTVTSINTPSSRFSVRLKFVILTLLMIHVGDGEFRISQPGAFKEYNRKVIGVIHHLEI